MLVKYLPQKALEGERDYNTKRMCHICLLRNITKKTWYNIFGQYSISYRNKYFKKS